jgi:phosphoglycerate dehydrogenase-like enzyme
METLLRESDFVSLSCPLNEKTFHLIGEKELRAMKKTAFLINTSRGPVVDEGALIKALQEGWILGAAIDVFEKEPTPADNPLLKMDNVIVTPHAIGWTGEVWSGKWDENIAQILALLKGKKPESIVNRDVWETPHFQEKLKKFLRETGGVN